MAIEPTSAPRAIAERAWSLPDLSSFAPVAAALAYPALLRGAYDSLHAYVQPAEWSERAGDLCLFSVAIAGAYAVPLLAVWLARRTVARSNFSIMDKRRLRVVHLAFAAPPLYTLAGVVTSLLHVGGLDIVAWVAIWGAAALYVAHGPRAEASAARALPPFLRSLHGGLALTFILLYLGAHLGNHLLALWTPQLHGRAMRALEIWYRNRAVEPALLILIACLLATGLTLAWRHTGGAPQDAFGVIQTLTGFYLANFITSHLCAAFLLARWEKHIATDWAWASGAPAGILGDSWNIRLLPHYSIAVWAVITHAGLGARQVMRAHGVASRKADRVAFVMSGFGAAVSLLISFALVGLHLGEMSY